MINIIDMYLPNYKVIIKNNYAYINDKTLLLKEEDKENIIREIRAWKEEYRGKALEETEYYIRIYNNTDLLRTHLFNGAFPENFNMYAILDHCREIQVLTDQQRILKATTHATKEDFDLLTQKLIYNQMNS